MESTDILIPSDETIAAVLASDTTEQAAPVTVVKGNVVISDASELVDKTVFLKASFGILGNSRKVSGSQVLSTDAALDRIKVSKTLLDSPELEAIKKADNKMRAYLYNTCLPFDMGIMVLPWGLVEVVNEKLLEYGNVTRPALVEEFIKVYPQLRDSAKKDLGTLYSEADYPAIQQVRAAFKFEHRMMSLSVPGKLKQISAALFQQETEKAATQIQSALEEITLIMRQELLDMVTNLEDRLAPGDEGKPKKFKATTVTNLQEFLNSFDIRNVTNDQELAAIVAKARELVSGVSAEGLRTSDDFREKIRAGMDSIKGQLSGLVEEAGRKFKFDEEETVSV